MAGPLALLVLLAGSCLGAQEIGDPTDGGMAPEGEDAVGHDGKPTEDAPSDRPVGDTFVRDASAEDAPARDAPVADHDAAVLSPDAGRPDQYHLLSPEPITPENNALFQPDELGFFSPLRWQTSEGATSTLRLWKLSSPNASVEESELLFNEAVGEQNTTEGLEGFPALNYRTDYAWEVTACSPRDLEECLTGGAWFFTTTHQGLVGWWRFVEGEGTTLRDWSGNGNDGTINGDPLWTEEEEGIWSLALDGIDDFVLVGDDENLEGMSGLTVEVWVNSTDPATNRSLVSKWMSRPSSYTLRTEDVDGPGTGRITFSTETTETESTDPTLLSTTVSTINNGAWHYLAGLYDGTMQDIVVDGLLQNALEQSGAILDSGEELCFGAFCQPEEAPVSFFPGLMGEVAIYQRALSEEERNENCQRHLLTTAICP